MIELVNHRNSSRLKESGGSLWSLMDPPGCSDQPPQICDNETPLLETALVE